MVGLGVEGPRMTSCFRRRAFGTVVFSLLLWALPCAAQSTPSAVLTLEQVEAAILLHHPTLEGARQAVVGARFEQMSAEGGFDPLVRAKGETVPFGPYVYNQLSSTVVQPTPWWGLELYGGWRIGRGDIPSYADYATNAYGELQAGINLPLLRNRGLDRRRADLARAPWIITAAQNSVSDAQLEVIKAGTRRYWEWVIAGRKVEVAKALQGLAQTRAEQMRTRARAGDLPRIDVTDNDRTLAQRNAGIVSAERSLQQAAYQLSLYWRDETGDPLLPGPHQLPGQLPEPRPVAQLHGPLDLEGMLARRPDLRQLEAEREQQRIERQYAENQNWTKLDLNVETTKDLGPGSAKLAKPELALGFSLDVPTFNRAARGKAGSIAMKLAQLDAKLKLAREKARMEALDTAAAVDAARERILLARVEVQTADAVADGERARYFHGDSSLFVVNQRELTATEARLRELDAFSDFLKADASLRALLAIPPRVGAPP
jgi:cobalt-zinc-cadmium efflux system outer membrane protein